VQWGRADRTRRSTRPSVRPRAHGMFDRFLGNWLPRSTDFPCTARSGTPKGRKAGTAGAATDARARDWASRMPMPSADRARLAQLGRAGATDDAAGTPDTHTTGRGAGAIIQRARARRLPSRGGRGLKNLAKQKE
jgi:hypothetical protein